jgi:hypothetical protein
LKDVPTESYAFDPNLFLKPEGWRLYFARLLKDVFSENYVFDPKLFLKLEGRRLYFA